jgi:hypothetical protein
MAIGLEFNCGLGFSCDHPSDSQLGLGYNSGL